MGTGLRGRLEDEPGATRAWQARSLREQLACGEDVSRATNRDPSVTIRRVPRRPAPIGRTPMVSQTGIRLLRKAALLGCLDIFSSRSCIASTGLTDDSTRRRRLALTSSSGVK